MKEVKSPFSLHGQLNSSIFHSFSTAFLLRYIQISPFLAHNCPGEGSLTHGQPRRFRLHGQAAGGYRPHHWRLRQAEEGRSAKFFRPMSVPRRKDGVVLRPRHAPVFSLLRLWRVRRRFQLRPENREHHLPRSRADGCPEARHPTAQSGVLDSRRSERSPPARPTPRRPRTRRRILSGMPEAPRRRSRSRISARPRLGRRHHRSLPHRLRPRLRLPPPRPPEKRIQRRPAPRKRLVFLEGKRRASGIGLRASARQRSTVRRQPSTRKDSSLRSR